MDLLQAIVLLVLSYIFYRIIVIGQSRSKKLPPGPFPAPIVGNIFQLGHSPYITFAKLAQTYGPLMRVKLGSQETIIVSSPEMAREVLMKHDLACSNRTTPYVIEALNHHKYSIIALDVGGKWSTLRRVFREHLFATHKLEETEELRQRKLHQLRDYLEDCSRSGTAVDIGEAVMVTNLNMLSNTMISTDFAAYGTTAAQEIRKAICTVTENAATPNPADYFPILRCFDPKGLKRKTGVGYGKLLRFFEEIVSKRMEARSLPSYSRKPDMLEELLDLNHQTGELSITDINHLLMDLILGGGDSTSLLIQWVMTELLRDPKKMQKAKAELRRVVGDDEAVESDIPKLAYLSAVIKETFRFRPGAPLLSPHRAAEDVEINSYTIPKGATILINVYAITRDPTVWPNPDSFEPERFLGNNIDYKGQFFELLPFGSGRRICPGMPLVHLTAHTLVARLIHSFDWKVEEVNVESRGGFFNQMAKPIRAIPIKNNYSTPIL